MTMAMILPTLATTTAPAPMTSTTVALLTTTTTVAAATMTIVTTHSTFMAILVNLVILMTVTVVQMSQTFWPNFRNEDKSKQNVQGIVICMVNYHVIIFQLFEKVKID